jgi:hypothetical protein
MGKRTEIKFFCDACGEELRSNTDKTNCHYDNQLGFSFHVDADVGPRLRIGYTMLCTPCLEGLIRTVEDFDKNARFKYKARASSV